MALLILYSKVFWCTCSLDNFSNLSSETVLLLFLSLNAVLKTTDFQATSHTYK